MWIEALFSLTTTHCQQVTGKSHRWEKDKVTSVNDRSGRSTLPSPVTAKSVCSPPTTWTGRSAARASQLPGSLTLEPSTPPSWPRWLWPQTQIWPLPPHVNTQSSGVLYNKRSHSINASFFLVLYHNTQTFHGINTLLALLTARSLAGRHPLNWPN